MIFFVQVLVGVFNIFNIFVHTGELVLWMRWATGASLVFSHDDKCVVLTASYRADDAERLSHGGTVLPHGAQSKVKTCTTYSLPIHS